MFKFYFEKPNLTSETGVYVVPGFKTKELASPAEQYIKALNEKFSNKESFSTNTLESSTNSSTTNPTNESFIVKESSNTMFDNLYKELIRSYTKAVSFYLLNNNQYRHWAKNWNILKDNIEKRDLKVQRLSVDDKDVAYTQNKGELLCFRWKDETGYILKDVFVYVVLHELTHQAFPKTFIGHASPFPEMLSILCVAGFELQLFDLSKIPKQTVFSNNQPITSRSSLRDEILSGIEILKQYNTSVESQDYYNKLISVVYEKSK